MTDISKCFGANCPIRETCYRYTAPLSRGNQSWLLIDYVNPCPEFWPDVRRRMPKPADLVQATQDGPHPAIHAPRLKHFLDSDQS